MKFSILSKIILLILFFPLACPAQDGYTNGIQKVFEVLWENSRERRDLEEGINYARDKTPVPVVKALEVMLPTLNALREQKLELRYVTTF